MRPDGLTATHRTWRCSSRSFCDGATVAHLGWGVQSPRRCFRRPLPVRRRSMIALARSDVRRFHGGLGILRR